MAVQLTLKVQDKRENALGASLCLLKSTAFRDTIP